jgi:hypothetical protein
VVIDACRSFEEKGKRVFVKGWKYFAIGGRLSE